MEDLFDKAYEELTEEERGIRREEVIRIRASDPTPARVLAMPEGVNNDHILMGTTQDYQVVVNKTQELLLSENNKADWLTRYQDYADTISANLATIRENRRRFREWSPFKVYLNTTNAKQARNSVKFDVRYLGQTVAQLTSNKEKITLSTKPSGKNYEITNKLDFGCEIQMRNEPWAGIKARSFRAHFKNREPIRNKNENRKRNEEHRLESLLLSEFSKSTGKILPNIKPVMIEELRFPMPTPLNANDHNTVKYSGKSGGGIDIFARVGTGGRATYLCIIELKDENNPREPATDVLKQAIKYTVFIRELLRSDAGAKWWKLFGFGGTIPQKLVFHSVCAMPNSEGADTSFANQKLEIGDDEIQLHYIYFDESSNSIENIKTSLSYGKQAEE